MGYLLIYLACAKLVTKTQLYVLRKTTFWSSGAEGVARRTHAAAAAVCCMSEWPPQLLHV